MKQCDIPNFIGALWQVQPIILTKFSLFEISSCVEKIRYYIEFEMLQVTVSDNCETSRNMAQINSYFVHMCWDFVRQVKQSHGVWSVFTCVLPQLCNCKMYVCLWSGQSKQRGCERFQTVASWLLPLTVTQRLTSNKTDFNKVKQELSDI